MLHINPAKCVIGIDYLSVDDRHIEVDGCPIEKLASRLGDIYDWGGTGVTATLYTSDDNIPLYDQGFFPEYYELKEQVEYYYWDNAFSC